MSNSPLSRSVQIRREIVRQALEIFEGWSYRELEVPLLDYFDHLRDVLDPNKTNQTFRFVDRSGNLRVLRSDVTPAIAKIYAHQLSGVQLPLRVCYANKVMRIERSFTSEQIESYQLGTELIGAAGMLPELEVILVCLETLATLGVEDVQLKLGNIAVYRRLLELSGIPISSRDAVTRAVLNRDPYEVQQLLHRIGVRPEVSEAVCCLATLRSGRASLEKIMEVIPTDAQLSKACASVMEIHDMLCELGKGDRVHLDLGHIHGPDYYTGTMFRVVSEHLGRELGGGGRYDGLIGSFGKDTPAVGFSLQLDALMEVLAPQAHEVAPLNAPMGSVVRVDSEGILEGLREALTRREQGLATRLLARVPRPGKPTFLPNS